MCAVLSHILSDVRDFWLQSSRWCLMVPWRGMLFLRIFLVSSTTTVHHMAALVHGDAAHEQKTMSTSVATLLEFGASPPRNRCTRTVLARRSAREIWSLLVGVVTQKSHDKRIRKILKKKISKIKYLQKGNKILCHDNRYFINLNLINQNYICSLYLTKLKKKTYVHLFVMKIWFHIISIFSGIIQLVVTLFM